MADTETPTAATDTPPGPEAGEVVIIGAGPAGLTAAWELTKRGRTATVLEADSVVGGISRTVERDGWRFDIGGHRFFTKVPEVEAVWHEILAGRRLPAAPAPEPHLLPEQVLRLPAPGDERAQDARHPRVVPLRMLVHRRAHQEAEGPDDVRGLGRGAVRVAPLPHVLQELHREGLGHPRRQAARRLGRAAHQEPLASARP